MEINEEVFLNRLRQFDWEMMTASGFAEDDEILHFLDRCSEDSKSSNGGVEKETFRSQAQHVGPTLMDCPVFCLQTKDGAGDGWRTTEGIWFTREEAEEYARIVERNYHAWQVFPKPAKGALRALLKSHTR